MEISCIECGNTRENCDTWRALDLTFRDWPRERPGFTFIADALHELCSRFYETFPHYTKISKARAFAVFRRLRLAVLRGRLVLGYMGAGGRFVRIGRDQLRRRGWLRMFVAASYVPPGSGAPVDLFIRDRGLNRYIREVALGAGLTG